MTIEERQNELEKRQALSEQDINYIKEGMDDIKDLLKEGMDDNRDFFQSINERMVVQEIKNTANEMKNVDNEKKITKLQLAVDTANNRYNRAYGWFMGAGTVGSGIGVAVLKVLGVIH